MFRNRLHTTTSARSFFLSQQSMLPVVNTLAAQDPLTFEHMLLIKGLKTNPLHYGFVLSSLE